MGQRPGPNFGPLYNEHEAGRVDYLKMKQAPGQIVATIYLGAPAAARYLASLPDAMSTTVAA